MTTFLQRIANAFRQRHWGLLAVELLVVVTGIFIGLQVDDWNLERKQRIQDANYLTLIVNDIQIMESQLNERIGQSEERTNRMFAALRAVETCDVSDDAITAISEALTMYQVTPPMNKISATFDEMVSSGALARLRDPEIKRAIVNVFSNVETMNRAIGLFRISLGLVDEVAWQFATYTYSADGRDVLADIDPGELCGSRLMQNAIVEMIDLQQDWMDGASRVDSAIKELLDTMGHASNQAASLD